MRTLQPLLFIPSDQAAAYREAFAEALWRAVGDAMRWWRRQIDRDVFQAMPVVEFVGRKPAEAYYAETQAKAEQELRAVWGVGRDGVTYLCYGLWGEGPYQSPGNVIGTSGDYLVVQSSTSLVIFADGAFPGYAPGEPWNSRAAQTGALAHELGHTLGLPHTEDVERGRGADSIMQEWWRYPNTGLTAREGTAVRAAIGAPRRG